MLCGAMRIVPAEATKQIREAQQYVRLGTKEIRHLEQVTYRITGDFAQIGPNLLGKMFHIVCTGG